MNRLVRVVLALLGTALCGEIPSKSLDPESSDYIFDGNFWTSWSEPYGCMQQDINPFGVDRIEGSKNFCRQSLRHILPGAVMFRFCTLPNRLDDSPFKYSPKKQTENEYFDFAGKTPSSISSFLQNPIKFFTNSLDPGAHAFSTSTSDWRNIKPPQGDGNKLTGWGTLYSNNAAISDRQNMYEHMASLQSDRIACDQRLQLAAVACYDGAFNPSGYAGGKAFCDNWDLADVTEKCKNSKGSDCTFGAVNKLGDEKNKIVQYLVLLIEDQLERNTLTWKTYIPSPYKKHMTKMLVCHPKCPAPTVWSEWSCFCTIDAQLEDNVHGLPLCNCKNQSRHRIQLCSSDDFGSCEIYAGSDVHDKCAKYGNAEILSGDHDVQLTGNSIQYFPADDTTYTLSNILNYPGNLTNSEITDKFYKNQNILAVNSIPSFCNAAQSSTVTKQEFSKVIHGGSSKFTYAVEIGTCDYKTVEHINTTTACSKTCGCGTKITTTRCVYVDTQLDVPNTADEYACCNITPPTTVSCNTQCCPRWHNCNLASCSADSAFVVGSGFTFQPCHGQCNKTLTDENRCFCKNTCDSTITDYDKITHYKTSACDLVNGYISATDKGNFNTDPDILMSTEGDLNFGAVAYIRTATKECEIRGVRTYTTTSSCSQKCGCESYTVETMCVFNDDQNPPQRVNSSDPEYICNECADIESVIHHACDLPCCPEWHTCSTITSKTHCTDDSFYTKGNQFQYSACTKECGTEEVPAEIRCMCQRDCNFGAHVNGYIGKGQYLQEDNHLVCDDADTANNRTKPMSATDIGYRRTHNKKCSLPCCVSVQSNPQTCPVLDCYSTDKTMPWFLAVNTTDINGVLHYSCDTNPPKYGGNQICDCDPTSTSLTCTHDSITYVKGNTFGVSLDECEYPRKDYINFNYVTNGITGAGNDEPYYCCTEENQHLLLTQWESWEDVECKFTDVSADTSDCGCTDDESKRCGMKTRRRHRRCNMKIDDTTCPCIQTQKCDMPLCPVQGPFTDYTSECDFNPIQSGSTRFYKVRHCKSRDWSPQYVPAHFYSSSSQYLSSSTCNWCDCDDQVHALMSDSICPFFDKDCEKLLWAEWQECAATQGTCGPGSRYRVRKCDSFTTKEEVEKHCYRPRVLRTFKRNAQLAMEDNSEYFETQECYEPCPNNWGEWTPCSSPAGQGMQMRKDLNQPTTMESRICWNKVGEFPSGLSDAQYTDCNAVCGEAVRQKYIYDYDQGNVLSTSENCILPPCKLEMETCEPGNRSDVDPGPKSFAVYDADGSPAGAVGSANDADGGIADSAVDPTSDIVHVAPSEVGDLGDADGDVADVADTAGDVGDVGDAIGNVGDTADAVGDFGILATVSGDVDNVADPAGDVGDLAAAASDVGDVADSAGHSSGSVVNAPGDIVDGAADAVGGLDDAAGNDVVGTVNRIRGFFARFLN